MIVCVENGKAALKDIAELRAFKFVAMLDQDRTAIANVLTRSQAGEIAGEFAWIAEAWLRREAGEQDADWTRRFDAMVGFARSKGWYDDSRSAVRAHIEWSPMV